jgi:imidazolonepropionase-like amidohydrolase
MSSLVLTNCTLVDGLRPAVRSAEVTLADGRIVDIGAPAQRGAEPDDATHTIDLAGKTVMPGLVAGHFHCGYVNVGPVTVPLGLENPIPYQTLIASRNCRLALEAGYTGAIGAGSPHSIDASIARAISEGLIPGPRLVASSRELSSTGHSNDWAPWWWEVGAVGTPRVCDGEDAFRAAVRDETRRGAKMIKLYMTGGHGVLSPASQMEMTRAEVSAAIETAKARGVLIRAHIANKEALLLAVELGIDIVDHGDGMDDECFAALIETDTALVPSLRLPEVMLADLKRRGTTDTAEFEADLERGFAAVAAASSAGVCLLLGDDYGSAILPHGRYGDELRTYATKVGIDPLDIIAWGTINGARAINQQDNVGTVESGKLADLLIVDGDPTQDIGVLADPANILAVLQEGKVVAGELPS